MAFGLGKSEKQPEDEVGMAPEERQKGSEDVAPADSDDSAQSRVASDADSADGPAAGGQTRENAPRPRMTFRPDFLDSDTPRPGEQAAVPATRPPEGDAFFVSVTKQGDTETHRFDHPSEARNFVEQLLEEGVPQEEMAAFSGRRLALKVSHRPVVHLASGGEG